ncbi:lysylphosphatidylglycerol synthase transmembrane domain-containing protein [Pseudothioclava nitratireducens]|uniref:lysylphosphatidylglycerol synthase transmembrane domain-containing protein n=1 Tax=Pseudothioclava nitratireducens TaxID=1928646 RepID=UPI0023DC5A46|nr:lysylphosphatidylglycerol synthase transmembrane domain-containing protein [Defluviimonas nitratireducens]MDF1619309.1 lysylphosphatidylglycerol synthase transmembrane domain-containing protein [Defluviimonas nitratireducens]
MMSMNAPTSAPRSRRLRDGLLLGGLLALVGLGLAGLASQTGWAETMAQLRRLDALQILGLLALSLVNYVMRAGRWHVLARRLGLNTGFLQNARHFLGGFAMSVTPGRVGELVRMRWIRRETGWAVERSAPLVLMDRASDLAAMGIILGASVALAAGGIAGAVPVTILALVAALVATRPRLLAALITVAYRLTGRIPRLFGRARSAARSLSRFTHAPTAIVALTLGLLGWFAEGYAFHLLLVWMGADIGLAKAVAIFVFSTLAGGLTGAPGGLGGAEAAMVALLSLDGIPLEVSIPATAVIRLTTLWFAILIGLAVFPIAERLSLSHKIEP